MEVGTWNFDEGLVLCIFKPFSCRLQWEHVCISKRAGEGEHFMLFPPPAIWEDGHRYTDIPGLSHSSHLQGEIWKSRHLFVSVRLHLYNQDQNLPRASAQSKKFKHLFFPLLIFSKACHVSDTSSCIRAVDHSVRSNWLWCLAPELSLP